MPAIHHANVPVEPFRGGATYQTVIGDPEGSTPIRLGIQTSPPGYKTPLHSHPYLESVTVLEGIGEAWIDGNEDQIAIAPGVTLVFPPNVRHQFRALGSEPLITLGVHASPHRIVFVDESGHGGLREYTR
jgi:quercetin dioxygenase-like cupin family protein